MAYLPVPAGIRRRITSVLGYYPSTMSHEELIGELLMAGPAGRAAAVAVREATIAFKRREMRRLKEGRKIRPSW